MAIDPSSRLPPYQQLADYLRSELAGLMEGELLPSTSRLMREHHVGRGVVRNALRLLQADGLIVVEAGVGAFKRPQPQTATVVLYPEDVLRVRPTTAQERRDYEIPVSVSMIAIIRADGGTELYPADRTIVVGAADR